MISKSWKMVIATLIIGVALPIANSFLPDANQISEEFANNFIYVFLGSGAIGASAKIAKSLNGNTKDLIVQPMQPQPMQPQPMQPQPMQPQPMQPQPMQPQPMQPQPMQPQPMQPQPMQPQPMQPQPMQPQPMQPQPMQPQPMQPQPMQPQPMQPQPMQPQPMQPQPMQPQPMQPQPMQPQPMQPQPMQPQPMQPQPMQPQPTNVRSTMEPKSKHDIGGVNFGPRDSWFQTNLKKSSDPKKGAVLEYGQSYLWIKISGARSYVTAILKNAHGNVIQVDQSHQQDEDNDYTTTRLEMFSSNGEPYPCGKYTLTGQADVGTGDAQRIVHEFRNRIFIVVGHTAMNELRRIVIDILQSGNYIENGKYPQVTDRIKHSIKRTVSGRFRGTGDFMGSAQITGVETYEFSPSFLRLLTL